MKQTSLLIKYIATLSGIAIIAAFVTLVFNPDWHNQMIAELVIIEETVSGTRLISLCLIAMLAALAIFGLWHIRALFSQYYEGNTFGEKPAIHITYIGIAVALAPILNGLASFAFIKFSVPDYLNEQYYVALHISGAAYLLFSIGILLVLIGWNMRRAAR